MTVFTDPIPYAVLVGVGAEDPPTTTPALVRKLQSFARLAVGWSHGEGIPVADEAIRVATKLVDVAALLQLKADAFPGLHGNCAVAFYKDQKCVEILIDPANLQAVGLRVEEGFGHDYRTTRAEDTATVETALRCVFELITGTWKSPVFSRSGCLMESAADFQMLYSSTHREPILTPQTAG